MIFDLLASPQGPRGRGKKSAVACPIHVSNSHTKFRGLGGDSLMDRQMDGGDCNIPDAFLKSVGIITLSSNIVSFIQH